MSETEYQADPVLVLNILDLRAKSDPLLREQMRSAVLEAVLIAKQQEDHAVELVPDVGESDR